MSRFFFILALFSAAPSLGQIPELDSLKALLKTAADTTRIRLLIKLADDSPLDSALFYAEDALRLAHTLKRKHDVAEAYRSMGSIYQSRSQYSKALDFFFKSLRIRDSLRDSASSAALLSSIGNIYRIQGRYPQALEYAFQALKLYEKLGDKNGMIDMLRVIGFNYYDQEKYKEALDYFDHSLKLSNEVGDKWSAATALRNIGDTYDRLGDNDRALSFCLKAFSLSEDIDDAWQIAASHRSLGRVYHNRSQYAMALENYQKSLDVFEAIKDKRMILTTYRFMGETFLKQKRLMSALEYAKRSVAIADEIEMRQGVKEGCRLLSEIYSTMDNHEKALFYFKQYAALKDSLFSAEAQSSIANLQTKLATEENASRIERLERDKDVQTIVRNSLIGGFLLLLVIVFLVATGYRQQQRQNTELQTALKHVRETQEQLIRAERMASVGQLATGVAHELQNPLNFVNNFSDLSLELLKELREGKTQSDKLDAALNDVGRNLEKIHYHGGRASSIVKSMLEYTQISSTEKLPTDLNALLTDSLKISYRAWQTQNEGAEVSFLVDVSGTIGKVMLSPQEMNRALMHLFNNGFYAMREKLKHSPEGYKPEMQVKSRDCGDYVEIRIRDNGIGIADNIKDKVFLPFFTTKPTGSGHTGLGLSMTYEIIVQGHQGDIQFSSKEGRYTEFIITLPKTQRAVDAS